MKTNENVVCSTSADTYFLKSKTEVGRNEETYFFVSIFFTLGFLYRVVVLVKVCCASTYQEDTFSMKIHPQSRVENHILFRLS